MSIQFEKGTIEKRYNLLIILTPQDDTYTVLLLFRNNPEKPFYGLWNAPGGTVEQYERPTYAAYRELFEETNISKDDLNLNWLNTFELSNNRLLDVFYGILSNTDIEVKTNDIDGCDLSWINIQDVFDKPDQFAPDLDLYIKSIIEKL